MDESSEIKLLRAKVALLETEKKHLTQKIASLEKQSLKTSPSTPPLVINSVVASEESHPDFPIEQKIQLIKNIFRGRDDVYARYWVSRKTGKSGYSPGKDCQGQPRESYRINPINIQHPD